MHILPTPTPVQQATTPIATHPTCNNHRDRKINSKNTSSITERTTAIKTTSTKDSDWEVVNKIFTSQEKRKLIRDCKCLYCNTPGYTFKECRKQISKQPIRTAVQVLSLQHINKPVTAKNNYKGKTKAQLQSTQALDHSGVQVQVNRHPALSLIDLHTTS